MLKQAHLFCLFITVLFSAPVFALNDYGLNKQLIESSHEAFLKNSELSVEKINQYRQKIQKRSREVVNAIITFEQKHENEDYEDVEEKVDEESTLLGYRLILEELDQLEKAQSKSEIYERSRYIFELDYATMMEGSKIGVSAAYELVRQFLKTWTVSKRSVSLYDEEASNLIDPRTGQFFDQNELQELKLRGEDISLFSPPKNTSFWKAKDIDSLDVEKNYTKDSLFLKGVDAQFPDGGTAEYKKVIKSQTKPKLKIRKVIKGIKHDFKLKVGAEIHSEVTAGALFMALGYGTDISRYVRDFTVVLPDGVSVEDVTKEWNSYYEKFDIEDYIKSSGVDSNGNGFITFIEGLIEAKPESLHRIGPWPWGTNGNRSFREVRAITLFNLWIGNNDIKEADNNKLILKKVKGKYERRHYQHDMGFSFGRYTREKPGEFPWDLVKEYGSEFVKFNFRSFQDNTGFDHVTYADARWMTRLISKLSRSQIKEAVRLGGWPPGTDELLVEKLIARRNQLVVAFDLSSEIKPLEYDRYLTTANGVVKNGELKQVNFEDYTQGFGNEYSEILKPFRKGMEAVAVDSLIAGSASLLTKATEPLGKFITSLATEGVDYLVSSTDYIDADPDDFSWDTSVVTNIKYAPSRKVIRNPYSVGDDDAYLVEDSLDIKFGLGVNVGLRLVGNYIKTYKVVYPVRTKKDGLYYNKFIFDLILPYRVGANKLPDRYIMIKESSYEAEKGFRANLPNSPLGVGISHVNGRLGRLVVVKKRDSYKVFKDSEPYSGFIKELFYNLGIFELPLWDSEKKKGTMNRDIYYVDLNQTDDKERLDALAYTLGTNNLIKVKGFAAQSKIHSNFIREEDKFNLLGLFKKSKKKRSDILSHYFYADDKVVGEKEHAQVGIDNRWKWRLISNGEEKNNFIRVTGTPNDISGDFKNVTAELKIKIIDNNTTSKEMSEYIKTINEIALNDQFIQYSPELHSRNGLWEKVEVDIELLYDQDAIETMAHIDTSSDYWYKIFEQTGKSEDFWTRSRRRANRSNNQYLPLRGERYKEFENNLTNFRYVTSPIKKLDGITEAFSIALRKEGHIVDPTILKIINEKVGKSGFFIRVKIRNPEGKELLFPAETPIYNEQGKSITPDIFYPFEYEEVEEIWRVFALDFY